MQTSRIPKKFNFFHPFKAPVPAAATSTYFYIIFSSTLSAKSSPDSLAHPEPSRDRFVLPLMFFFLRALDLCLPSSLPEWILISPFTKENWCSEVLSPCSFQDKPKIELFNSAASMFREEKNATGASRLKLLVFQNQTPALLLICTKYRS